MPGPSASSPPPSHPPPHASIARPQGSGTATPSEVSDEPQPPAGTSIRAPGWDDLDAVTALHAAAARARTGHIRVRREDLRIRWLGLEDLRDAVLVHDGDGSLLAYAAFEADHDPASGELDLHIDAVVDPAATGRGLASFLLDRAIVTAARLAAALGCPQAVLTTALVDGDEPARAFHAAKGFTPVRHLLELHLDLHAPPPAPVWPDALTVAPLEPTETRAVWDVHQRAFADVPTHLPLDHDEFVHDRLTGHLAVDPELSLVARDPAGAIVGVLLGRAGTPVAPEDGWVRDLGVVPAWRRHGIGMALLRTAFAQFRTRGLTGVGLDVDDVTVDGAVALYRRAGMRIVRRTDVLARPVDLVADLAPAPTGRIPGTS